MRASFAALALVGLAAAAPQGAVTSQIAPSSSPPPGCSENYQGSFNIQIVNASDVSKRELVARQKAGQSQLGITLVNGVLTDPKGRTGYIASNNQFQFDGPPQAGAIYTAGWSVCQNQSLALGGDANFFKCESGSGFYNLYNEYIGSLCSPIIIQVVPAGPAVPASTPATISGATPAPTPTETYATSYYHEPSSYPSAMTTSSASAVGEMSDGQPTGTPVAPVSTASASAACSEYVDGQPQCASAASTGGAPVATYTGPAIATGAANALNAQAAFGLAAGVMAVALL